MPERKRPLGRLRHRWMELGDVEYSDVDWIELTQDRNKLRSECRYKSTFSQFILFSLTILS
jgi:hypothetical protein